MEISHVEDGGTGSVTSLIYEAAMKGCVVTLDRLLKQCGEAVLCRFSLASFAETPLHLAALKGHLEVSKRLLELNPELATEQDAEKCTPLHLAAANGHAQVVRELLKANEKACLVQDQQGRVPLHLAAMRGRSQVVTELLNCKQAQASLKMKVDDGDSILHLCVKYNHLAVLKLVLDSTGNDGEVLKMTDSRGNTVLHSAVMLKQSETVRFLLELPRVKTEVVDMTNGMEFSALDVLNHSPKDYRSLEIREILLAGSGAETVRRSHRPPIGADGLMRREGDGAAEVPGKAQDQGKESRTWKMWVCQCLKWLMDYRGDWMNETRGSLMMVSTIIATVTFAAAISPPGGVWQEDTISSHTKFGNCNSNVTDCHTCTKNKVCVAGNAVLAYYYPNKFIAFMKYNMISFISSLVVVFLIIGGFPLSNKFFLWILSLAMCLTVSFLGLTFLEALWLVIPDPMLDRYNKFKNVSVGVWATMIAIVGLFLLARLSYWVQRIRHSPKFKSTWRRFVMSKLLPV